LIDELLVGGNCSIGYAAVQQCFLLLVKVLSPSLFLVVAVTVAVAGKDDTHQIISWNYRLMDNSPYDARFGF
jgi:hypothetical protein